jgi:hypothetical protein
MKAQRTLRTIFIAMALAAGSYLTPQTAEAECRNCFGNMLCPAVNWGGSDCKFTCIGRSCWCQPILGPCTVRPQLGLQPF